MCKLRIINNAALIVRFFHNNALHTAHLNALFRSRNASDVTMRYLLRTNKGYEHLAKKFERAVLTHVERDSSEMAVCI